MTPVFRRHPARLESVKPRRNQAHPSLIVGESEHAGAFSFRPRTIRTRRAAATPQTGRVYELAAPPHSTSERECGNN